MQRVILGGVLILSLAAGSMMAAEKADAEKTSEKKTSEKMLSASGTIQRIDAANRTFLVSSGKESPTQFLWTAQTKINGTLSQGAKVTIRFTTLSDGQNVASQISVGR